LLVGRHALRSIAGADKARAAQMRTILLFVKVAQIVEATAQVMFGPPTKQGFI